MTQRKIPKISIGLPVFNGERFIEKKIKSILSQTFKDFELIISDNSSTDMTSTICESYAKIDNRIKFFHQTKNIGAAANFNFVLEKSEGAYFMWTAVDDKIMPGFIEKNLNSLKNPNIVCSANQVKYYGEKTDSLENLKNSNVKKKIITRFSPLRNISVSGELNKKIRKYLRIRGHHHVFYGIYRTKEIKKIFVTELANFDLATMLNTLKFGDIYVNEEILMYRYDGGISSKGFFNFKKSMGLNFCQALFHMIPFTKWFLKNFGFKIFLKNLDSLFLWNLEVFFYFGIDTVRRIKGKLTKYHD